MIRITYLGNSNHFIENLYIPIPFYIARKNVERIAYEITHNQQTQKIKKEIMQFCLFLGLAAWPSFLISFLGLSPAFIYQIPSHNTACIIK